MRARGGCVARVVKQYSEPVVGFRVLWILCDERAELGD